jgi:hypothetical protein
MIIFPVIMVYEFFKLDSLSTISISSEKIVNLNSIFHYSTGLIHFTSYIEKDAGDNYIWLTDGSEAISIIEDGQFLNDKIFFNFTKNPCGEFIPLKIKTPKKVEIIYESKKINLFLTKVEGPNITILPLKNNYSCRVIGDDRNFFGKIYFSES